MRPRNLSMHKSGVAALRLRARDRAVARAVVVQELLREVTARNCHSGATGDVAVDEEGAIFGQRTEL